MIRGPSTHFPNRYISTRGGRLHGRLLGRFESSGSLACSRRCVGQFNFVTRATGEKSSTSRVREKAPCYQGHSGRRGWRPNDAPLCETLPLAAQRGGHREQYLISFHGLWQPMELVMPLTHSDLQTLTSLLVARQWRFSANWSRALLLGTLLFATLNSARAQDQDTGALPTVKTNPAYPAESEITFQWNYVCPTDRPCTFVCRGAGGGGGSDHVTRLDIYLGTLPLSADQPRAGAIFYDFASREFPHSAGFAISTGINSLSCQSNGMNLDYSGPPPDTVPTSPIKPNRARPEISRQ
jgi:hypothetical protein